MLDVAIIGGGLSGLTLAQQLSQQGQSFAVYEARDRFGGRILSHSLDSDDSPTYRTDLGPCWVWPDDQPRMAALIDKYKLKVTPQWLAGESLYQADHHSPAQKFVDHTTYAAARRFSTGTYNLIETFLTQLPTQQLHLNHQLTQLYDRDDYVELHFKTPSKKVIIQAKQVVLCLPPRVILKTISFAPALSESIEQVMQSISTWMAGHAKAVIYYKHAFWRQAGYSGSAFAAYQGAALAEIFDSCSADGSQAALSGFFALPPALRHDYYGDLSALIIEQLVRLFGEQAANPESIIIQDWFTDKFTATAEDETSPLFHPGYGHPILQLDHWNDKLFFCGTETAKEFGGYLEGALVAADRVAKSLALSFQSRAKGVSIYDD